ncbi:MAG: TolC family protein, partial [Bacteroidota bacterium]
MMQKKSLLAVLVLMMGNLGHLSAQELLEPDEAIRIALENGYDIVIAQKGLEINKNNNTRGNAGFLPRVDLSAEYSGSRNDTRQEFLDGRTQSVNGAINSRLSGGVNATWTVFDGFVMFNLYRGLGIAQENAQLNLSLQMENTIAQILTLYYGITLEEQNINILHKNLEVSRERLR